jgi:predicted transcriptional regulator
MLLLDRQFFKPSRKLRTLALMEALSAGEHLTQNDLGIRAAMSSAMVNQYLKDLDGSEMLTYVPVNGKSYRYNLTGNGEKLRRDYFGQYCSEIVQAYSALKAMVRQKLAPLEESGRFRLVLFGASETCEVVLSALQGSRFRILGLVDNDPDKHGKQFHGHFVSPPMVLERLDAQAVVITSFGHQEDIYNQLVNGFSLQNVEIVRL